ncbi:response regulator transcription factor [Streptomyces canus]|uniref:response regulator n=1 Tax=Streptomyces canus TaxID=58343 RepID=UPI00386FBE3E
MGVVLDARLQRELRHRRGLDVRQWWDGARCPPYHGEHLIPVPLSRRLPRWLPVNPDIEVVAEAVEGQDTVELVRRHRPAVAVLDIRMPGINGIDAAAEIHNAVPATSVIMLTTFGEDDYILKALGGGAAGFLIKSGEPEELITGVRRWPKAPPTCHRRSRPGSSRTSPRQTWAPWPVRRSAARHQSALGGHFQEGPQPRRCIRRRHGHRPVHGRRSATRDLHRTGLAQPTGGQPSDYSGAHAQDGQRAEHPTGSDFPSLLVP